MMRRLAFDLAIYRDRVQLTDRETGQFVDQRSEYPFSGMRLVEDIVPLEHALSHALRKLLVGGVILSEIKACVVRTELPLSPSETELVRGVLNALGVKDIEFGPQGML